MDLRITMLNVTRLRHMVTDLRSTGTRDFAMLSVVVSEAGFNAGRKKSRNPVSAQDKLSS